MDQLRSEMTQYFTPLRGDRVERISGFSAKFVALDEDVQDEIIARVVSAA